MRDLLIILFIILALAYVWFITGGPKEITAGKGFFGEGSGFSLPAFLGNSPTGRISISEDELWEPADPSLRPEGARDTQTFGLPSPHRGFIFINKNGSAPTKKVPAEEYIVVETSSANTLPIDITGWSLQSMISRSRIYVRQATPLPSTDAAEVRDTVSLRAGERAILSSGDSPVGVSFHTNSCTGYLNQFQDFYPRLSQQCPNPSEVLPVTIDNVRTYGSECIDVVRSTPRCTFPLELPDTLTPVCTELLQNELNYRACVARHKNDANFFADGEWRIYFGARSEIWREKDEIIRLLDADGRVVDVFSY